MTPATSTFFAISSHTLEQVESALGRLRDQSHARCALVIDRTGCILASVGDFHPMGPDTMAAVAAGAIAALNTLVARAESQEVSIRFFGAALDRIHFALISDRVILTLVHPHSTTSGLIRPAVKNFVARVRPLLAADQTKAGPLASVQFIEDKLDELFKDSSSR